MKNPLIILKDKNLSKSFNSNRINGCSVKSILRGSDTIPFAIECNCGPNVYHPVLNKGKTVYWNHSASIVESNPDLVQEKITKRVMQLWIEEE